MITPNFGLRRTISVGFVAVATVLAMTSAIALVLDLQPFTTSVRDLCAAYLFWYAAPEITTSPPPSAGSASGAAAAARSVALSWRRPYVVRARRAERQEPAPRQ